MITKFLMLMFLMIFCTNVYADNQEESLKFAKGSASFTVKPIIKSFDETGLKFWMISFSAKPFIYGDYKAQIIETLYRANRNTGEYSMLSELYYSPKGGLIEEIEYEQDGFSMPPPRSPLEMAYTKACNSWEESKKLKQLKEQEQEEKLKEQEKQAILKEQEKINPPKTKGQKLLGGASTILGGAALYMLNGRYFP